MRIGESGTNSATEILELVNRDDLLLLHYLLIGFCRKILLTSSVFVNSVLTVNELCKISINESFLRNCHTLSISMWQPTGEQNMDNEH